MTYTNKIGSNIRSARVSKGYSQEYIASMLGISQSTYANIESNKVKVTMERLIQISAILDADIHHLIDADYPKNEGSSMRLETKELYLSLIAELKNEICFLRGLVKDQ